MKVKVISRNPDDYLRETKRDLHKVPRNFNPDLHPFEAPREYVRALNATKLERVFAKPFIASLDGHTDGLSCLAKHPESLSILVSGAFNGEVFIWDVPQRKELRSFLAHETVVRGITFTTDAQQIITVSDDKTIKFWENDLEKLSEEAPDPRNTLLSKSVLTCITHHRKKHQFATSGEVCQLWEETRNTPLRTFQWGSDTSHHVAFNPIQSDLMAACASDRSIVLYDSRERGPVRKIIMQLRSNRLCWNPMEAYHLTCASEDYNLYTFDTRNLRTPINVHMDHVAAVTDIDYAPTGKEFVTGSYDKSIRVFEVDKGHSREIYHTKRMQRLTCVQWSLDNRYIFSGSDEMNIRIWKARAAEKLGVLKPREKAAFNYNQALKEKFASHPQIKRIARHRQVPKHIYNAQREIRTIKNKQKRKESNKRKHSRRGAVPFVPERAKHVISEQE